MSAVPVNKTGTLHLTACLVEPDAAEARRIGALLASLGLAVATYPDGASLLAAAPPQATCVISEMALPDMTGAELIAALRARGLEAPVILLAAGSEVAAAVAGIRAGALDYIERPQMERLLTAHVRRLIKDAGSDPARGSD
jgi:two-component system response regulator FixJ